MRRPLELGLDAQWVMRALALYQLLTLTQLAWLGVADGSKRRLEAALILLRRKHLVGHRPAEVVRYGDKLPAVFWLLPRGAAHYNAAIRNPRDEVKAKGSERTWEGVEQTPHRIGIVDVHLALDDWAGQAGAKVRFRADFEPVESNALRPTTMVAAGFRFIPDAVISVNLPDGSSHRLMLEVERGGHKQDLHPFRTKGLPHWRGVAENRVVELALDLTEPPLFLIVFQSAAMRRSALAQWPQPRAAVWGRFFCKGLDELGDDFNSGWWRPNGAQRALFPEVPRSGSTLLLPVA